MVRTGQISVGGLVAFLAYGEILRWPTMGLGYILAVVQRGRASYGRIREILDSRIDVSEMDKAREPRDRGELKVCSLDYSIGDRQILSDVSFVAPAQSTLAIIGRTGGGKSTLAALLLRLLPTPPNTVFLDGDDIVELRLERLRKRVGYAQQEPFLFSESVGRNIGYSLDSISSKYSFQKIREAAALTKVLDEIEELPGGFDTLVGERGVQLSGGQKQRIALARALLGRPRVLVMDDPLSAVDAETENEILKTLKRIGQGRTVVLITNRVSAAAQCQHIVVLDNGRIVEQGDHHTLLNGGGLYATIAARQSLEQKLSDF
jgi:ATP-binding cassette subfamily B protein